MVTYLWGPWISRDKINDKKLSWLLGRKYLHESTDFSLCLTFVKKNQDRSWLNILDIIFIKFVHIMKYFTRFPLDCLCKFIIFSGFIFLPFCLEFLFQCLTGLQFSFLFHSWYHYYTGLLHMLRSFLVFSCALQQFVKHQHYLFLTFDR